MSQNLQTQLAQRAAQGVAQSKGTESVVDTVAALLKSNWKAIQNTIPKHVTPERLTRVALTVIANNRDLMECTPMSLVGAIMQCARYGFEPNVTGEAWIIPYRNKKNGGKREARFQLGYIGVVQLMYRSGFVSSVGATEVCENDDYLFEYGPGRAPYVKKAQGERGKVLFYFAWVSLTNGGFAWEYMTKAEVDLHRDHFSKQPDGFGWTDNFDSMAKKTVLLKAGKFAPKSVEMQAAFLMDGKTADPQRIDDVAAYILPEEDDDETESLPEDSKTASLPEADAAQLDEVLEIADRLKDLTPDPEPEPEPEQTTITDAAEKGAANGQDTLERLRKEAAEEAAAASAEPNFRVDFSKISDAMILNAVGSIETADELNLFVAQNQAAIFKLEQKRQKSIMDAIAKRKKQLK